MVNLRPPLLIANDLFGRANRRMPAKEKHVGFIERAPLALKNHVKSTGSKGRAKKVCMDEMMSVMTCLEKFNQNQTMCAEEIKSFEKCYNTFHSQERAKKFGEQTTSAAAGPKKDMTVLELNNYMKQFSQSSRKRQFYKEGFMTKEERQET